METIEIKGKLVPVVKKMIDRINLSQLRTKIVAHKKVLTHIEGRITKAHAKAREIKSLLKELECEYADDYHQFYKGGGGTNGND